LLTLHKNFGQVAKKISTQHMDLSLKRGSKVKPYGALRETQTANVTKKIEHETSETAVKIFKNS
jgi:hypothetical protein